MTDNPFDAMPGGGDGPGGFDLGSLLQQAQQMQSDLQAAQEQLASTTVEGSVAGGAVTVRLTGAGELTGLVISPEAVSGTDTEALADLSDLVVAAYRDARAKAEKLAQDTLGPLAGGLPGGAGGAPGGAPGQLGF